MTSETFVIDDDDQYSRFRLIAWWDQDRLRDAHILVVGAGALGNEVLKNLSLLGVGRVTVIDSDTIESSNLARSVLFRRRDCGRPKAEVAAEALGDMNPDTKVTPLHGNVLTDVGLGMFRDVDVVIGCLDNREARLWVNRCCWKVKTPWIDGGIQEINGVVKVFQPPSHACYECGMTETDYRLINLRYSCPLLRQEDILAGKVPTAPTISSMIGGLQTQEALKLLHGMPVEPGAVLVYNGVANRFYSTQIQRREDCLSHESYQPIIEVPLSASSPADELLAAAAEVMPNGQPLELVLDRDLVVSLDCGRCNWKREVLKPLALVGMSQAECPECGDTSNPQLVHRIGRNSPLAARKLNELGIPDYDIVRVASEQQESYFLLAGDRNDRE